MSLLRHCVTGLTSDRLWLFSRVHDGPRQIMLGCCAAPLDGILFRGRATVTRTLEAWVLKHYGVSAWRILTVLC
jgi:hypothetical protein